MAGNFVDTAVHADRIFSQISTAPGRSQPLTSQGRRPLDVLLVAGARPNFMKVAPLIQELRKDPGSFRTRLIHTGQHYDAEMSDVFFDDLQIPRPDASLGVGSGSHAQQTARVM